MNRPTVSVIMFCKNRSQTIRRAIDSILQQTYPNVEVIVQDGASTDGTLEILQSYGDAIKLISQPDSGNNEAFHKALQRCTGEYVGSCLSDEELFPDALENAVAYFTANPLVDAITGDADIIDFDGNIIGEYISDDFNLVRYLVGEYCPYFVSSFFRRDALVDAGVMGDTWNPLCIEFEIWCRLGADKTIRYVPRKFARYGIHPQQLSNIAHDINVHMSARLQVIERLFSHAGVFSCAHNSSLNPLKFHVIIRQFVMQYNHMMNNRMEQAAVQYLNYYLFYCRLFALHLASLNRRDYQDDSVIDAIVHNPSALLGATKPETIEGLFPSQHEPWTIDYAPIMITYPADQPRRIDIPPLDPALYATVGREFEQRGQIDKALDCFKHAEALDDIFIDSEACQMALKSPDMSEPDIALMANRWAEKYKLNLPKRSMQPSKWMARLLRGNEIRIAFAASNWAAPYLQHQIANWVKEVDRPFKRYCYTQFELPERVRSSFDVIVMTDTMNDDQFAQQVRNDSIDVIHEVTGLSQGHRFRSFSQRCAPIQISYANHVGTTGIPNVDYLIGDVIATPAQADPLFAETIWRMQQCFFCFSYDRAELPPLSAPPLLENGFVTFGCFGSGSKFNPAQLALWAQMLLAVPKSRLVLGNFSMNKPANRDYFLRMLGQHGIAHDRVTLKDGMTSQQVKESYCEIDISLDTWPYCGGNTLAESFWQGVPAVSLRGDRFSASYGASILGAAGLWDLVANNPDQYVEKARELAADTSRLIYLRRALRGLVSLYGFSDPYRFAKAMETTYHEMLARHPR